MWDASVGRLLTTWLEAVKTALRDTHDGSLVTKWIVNRDTDFPAASPSDETTVLVRNGENEHEPALVHLRQMSDF